MHARVLHTLWSARFGGIEKLVLDLTSAQRRRPRLKASVLICRGGGEFLPAFEKAARSCYDLSLKGGYDISPFKVRRAVNLMNRHDVVHMHTYTPLVALAASRSTAPIVYTEHGNFQLGRNTTISDRVKRRLLKRFLNRKVALLTFNSEWTRRQAENRYGLSEVDRRVVLNGIDLRGHAGDEDSLPREMRARLAGSFVVGTTSRFAGFKRIDRLIEGFARFQDGKETLLLLVGDGILRKEYERLVDRWAIREKTVFTGFQPNVSAYQKAMDLCVFPSAGEPFGLAALEAMALGRPVIVFEDGGGMAEIVGSFDAGDVVDGIPGLVERLNGYFAARGKPKDRTAGRVAHARRFDIDTMASRLESIYDRVTAGNGPLSRSAGSC